MAKTISTLEEDLAKLGLNPSFILNEMKTERDADFNTKQGASVKQMQSASLFESEEVKAMNKFQLAKELAEGNISYPELEKFDAKLVEEVEGLDTQYDMEKAYSSAVMVESEDWSWVNNKPYGRHFNNAMLGLVTNEPEVMLESYNGLNAKHQEFFAQAWKEAHGANAWARLFEDIQRSKPLVESEEIQEIEDPELENKEDIADAISSVESFEEVEEVAEALELKEFKIEEGMDLIQAKHLLRESVIAEGLKKKKLKKMKPSEKSKARRTYRKNKAKIKRKLKKLKAKPKYKKHKAKLKRLTKGKDAGARKKFVVEGFKYETNLVEGMNDLQVVAENLKKAALDVRTTLIEMSDYVRVGEALKPIKQDLETEPLNQHMGQEVEFSIEDGKGLEKAGVDDKESKKHIGKDEPQEHIYLYASEDINSALEFAKEMNIKAVKGGKDYIALESKDADKLREKLKEEFIMMDEDRELVRQFQKVIYQESLDTKIETIIEDASAVSDKLRKELISQSDANSILKTLEAFFKGTLGDFQKIVSSSVMKYVGQDDPEEEDGKPVKTDASLEQHIGTQPSKVAGEPVKTSGEFEQHLGKKPTEAGKEPTKPEGDLQHLGNQPKEMNKKPVETKPEFNQHLGTQPSKVTAKPVGESVEDVVQEASDELYSKWKEKDGSQVEVWRDKKLGGSMHFAKKIKDGMTLYTNSFNLPLNTKIGELVKQQKFDQENSPEIEESVELKEGKPALEDALLMTRAKAYIQNHAPEASFKDLKDWLQNEPNATWNQIKEFLDGDAKEAMNDADHMVDKLPSDNQVSPDSQPSHVHEADEGETLSDLAKKNIDNREDWVLATVASGVGYALTRASGTVYFKLKQMPELFYKAVDLVKSKELKGTPGDVADWMKQQADSGDELPEPKTEIEPEGDEPIDDAPKTEIDPEEIEDEVKEESKKKITEEKASKKIPAKQIEFDFNDYKSFLASVQLPPETDHRAVNIQGDFQYDLEATLSNEGVDFSVNVPNQTLKATFEYYTSEDKVESKEVEFALKNIKVEFDNVGTELSKNGLGTLSISPKSIMWDKESSLITFG